MREFIVRLIICFFILMFVLFSIAVAEPVPQEVKHDCTADAIDEMGAVTKQADFQASCGTEKKETEQTQETEDSFAWGMVAVIAMMVVIVRKTYSRH